MWLVRVEDLSNASTEISWFKHFWGKNYKQCQHWVMTSIAYRKEMRVIFFLQINKEKVDNDDLNFQKIIVMEMKIWKFNIE